MATNKQPSRFVAKRGFHFDEIDYAVVILGILCVAFLHMEPIDFLMMTFTTVILTIGRSLLYLTRVYTRMDDRKFFDKFCLNQVKHFDRFRIINMLVLSWVSATVVFLVGFVDLGPDYIIKVVPLFFLIMYLSMSYRILCKYEKYNKDKKATH